MKNYKEYELIVYVFKSLFEKTLVREVPAGLDWNVLLSIADRHNLYPLFWQQLSLVLNELPDGTVEQLESGYCQTLYNQVVYTQEIERLTDCLSSEGEDVILLKGARWFEEVYPQPWLRTFADIDILVKKENLDKAGRLLSELGYKTEGNLEISLNRHHCHYVLPQNGIKVELHWGLSHPKRVNMDINAAWHRARYVKFRDKEVLALSALDDILHLAMHIGSHGLMSRLIWFLDFALIFKKYRAELETVKFWETAKNSGCRRALMYCLFMAGNLCDKELLSFIPQKDIRLWERFLFDFVWDRKLLFAGCQCGLVFKYALVDSPGLAFRFTGSRINQRLIKKVQNLHHIKGNPLY